MENEKSKVINNIMNDISIYCSKDKSLKIDILDYEWEIFFNIIYESLENKKETKDYYSILWAIICDTFNRKSLDLVNRYPLYLIERGKLIKKNYITNKFITINSLLKSLRLLELYKFKKDEIMNLSSEIQQECLLGEVIDVKEYIKRY